MIKTKDSTIKCSVEDKGLQVKAMLKSVLYFVTGFQYFPLNLEFLATYNKVWTFGGMKPITSKI